jgi:hypothetical protein
MESTEVGIAILPEDGKRGRDGAAPRRQDHPSEQCYDVWPSWSRERIDEPYQSGQEALLKGIGGGGETMGQGWGRSWSCQAMCQNNRTQARRDEPADSI